MGSAASSYTSCYAPVLSFLWTNLRRAAPASSDDNLFRRDGGRCNLHCHIEQLRHNGRAQACCWVPALRALETVLTKALTAAADGVCADGDIGEGAWVLIQERIQITHRSLALGNACLVEERDKSSECRRGGRGAPDAFRLPIRQDLEALPKCRNIRRRPAAWWERPR